MNFHKMCRICTKEVETPITIFGEVGRRNEVPTKIGLCLPIKVKEYDDLPKQICLNCLIQLNASYKLYNGSLKAESIIKNLMKLNPQNNCEVVELHSKEELIKKIEELGSLFGGGQIAERVSLTVGNTTYILNAGSQNDTVIPINEQRGRKAKLEEAAMPGEDTSNCEQEAKKAKLEQAAVAGGSSMRYTAGPLGQNTRMPCAPGAMTPTAPPHGELNIVPMPVLPTFAVPSMQAASQAFRTTVSEVQEKYPDIQILTQKPVSQATNVIRIKKPMQCIALVKPMKTSQIRPVPITKMQLMSPNRPTVTGRQTASAQGTVEVFPLQTDQVVNNEEKSASEILPIIKSGNPAPVATKRSSRSLSTQESSLQKLQEPEVFFRSVYHRSSEYAAEEDPLWDDRDKKIAQVRGPNRKIQQLPEGDFVPHKNEFFSCSLCKKKFLFKTTVNKHKCN